MTGLRGQEKETYMSLKNGVQVLGLHFKNPIVVASTDIARTAEQFRAFAESGVGAIITKSVTDAPALQDAGIARIHIADMYQRPVRGEGYPDQYYFFSRGGSMLSMEAFGRKAPELLAIGKENGVVVIGSIAASNVENWVSYARQMEQLGFPAIELNFGNPHGEASKGKLGFLIGQSPELCRQIAGAVRRAVSIPVIVKLTPQVSSVAEIIKALYEEGISAVTVMHRFQGLMVDPETDEPVLGGWAALGGPWMKPVSLANVARARRAVPEMTILGGNGADTARDVYDYMCCGASLVEVGSSMMLRGPEYASALVEELDALVYAKGMEEYNQVVGRTADHIVTYQNLGSLPRRQVAVQTELCRDCQERPCLRTCYFGGVKPIEAGVLHDDEACSGCGLCLHSCPKRAVSIEEIS